jgi:hypothetical protein
MFANLLIDGIIRGLEAAAGLLWNELLAHPWMFVIAAGLVALSLISRRAVRRPRRRYR